MLIQTKLGPPYQGVKTLARAPLVERIAALATTPLIIVNAPAGYGKTTLLAQCFARWQEEGVLVGWYSVDERQLEAEQFIAYIIFALHRAGLALPYSEQAVIAGVAGISDDAAANALLSAMEESEEPIRLVIDDYQRVASPRLDAFVTHLVDRLPAHASIILAMRGNIGLPITALKSQGRVALVDQTDLRFTDEEAAALLEPGSDAGKWSGLVRETEGWPAVLQLLRANSDVNWATGAPGTSLIARSGDLARYLAEEVFVGLPEDLQSFLLGVCWVSEVCGDLADALTGGSDGRQQLERLERMNLLVTPVDDYGEWYRLHPLLSEFLRGWLSRTRRGHDLVLHERAAHWYAARHLLPEALDHARRLQDPLAPFRILEQAMGWRIIITGGILLMRHITETPLVHCEAFPRVWLARCYLAAHEGRIKEARAILETLVAGLAERPDIYASDPVLRAEVLAIQVVTWLYQGQPFGEDVIRALREQLDLHAGDAFIATLLRHLLCATAYSNRNFALCQLYGEEALHGARLANMPFSEAYTHQYLSLSWLSQGRVQEAEISLRRASERAVRYFGEGSSAHANTRVLLGRAHYLKGDLDAAKAVLTEAVRSIQQAGGWLDTFIAGYGTLAWIFARVGTVEQSRRTLADARTTAIRHGYPRLACYADIIEARLMTYRGEIDGARQYVARATALSESLGDPNPAMYLELRLAGTLAGAVAGDRMRDEIRALSEEASRSQSMADHLQALLLRALMLVENNPREAVMALRDALELATGEGLLSLVIQFGRALQPVYEAAGSRMDLLAPPQRAALRDLMPESAACDPAGDAAILEGRLTRREIDVLRALGDGLSSKEIARRLHVAESTVKTHRINMYRKLDVTMRSKAIEVARSAGLI